MQRSQQFNKAKVTPLKTTHTAALANLEAEQSVLGAILLRPAVLDQVATLITPADFFREAHGQIFQAMLDLREAQKPVDLVSVTALLKERGQLDGVGGTVFLATLSEQVGVVSNADYYAKLVHDKARLRRFLDKTQQVSAACFGPIEDTSQFLDQAAQELFEATGSASQHTVHLLDNLVKSETQVIEQIYEKRRQPGIAVGFQDLGKLFSWVPGDLVILAARPSMGKTALALNFTWHIAQQGIPVLVFTLETSKEQITRRFMSLVGRINGHRLNLGKLTQEEWVRLYQIHDQVKQMPILIDDTPSLSIAEIRARARRLTKKGSPGFVVVDYLQLIKPLRRGRSREEEVAEISRGLKALAKELHIPLLAISSLNRKLEDRPDKRPQLADLRECLPLDEWIDTPDGPVQLREAPQKILTIGVDGPETAPCVFLEKKPNRVYRVQTQFGAFSATANHPVLTGAGWKCVRDLKPGYDVIASPKRIPHANRGYLPYGRLLGWLLGNGYLKGTPSLTFRNVLAEAVESEVAQFGVRVNLRQTQKSGHVVTEVYLSNGRETGCLPNPIMEWLRSLGLEGKTSHDKFIPLQYLGSSDQTHKELLQGLMEADGTVTDGVAKYTTTSEILARQVKWLLHTIGVRSTINYYPNSHAGLWEVRAAVEDNNHLQEICANRQRFGELRPPSPNYIDPAPGLLMELLSALYRDPRTFQRRPDGTLKQLPKERILNILHGCPLPIADNLPYLTMKNMGWGRILSVDPVEGRIPVGDLQVPQTHCFLTNGLVVHNSGAIEFDADVILFLHREEVYKKATTETGVAEVSVAKHKNGPIGTIKLAYQKEFHRFEDYAEERPH